MATFASKVEFEARHGSGDERVEPLLGDASAVMRRALSSASVEWAVAPEKAGEAPDDVKALCIKLAFRAWSNPEGIESEQLGAHRVSYQRGAPGLLELTKTERRELRQAAGVGSFWSSTLRTPYSGDEDVDSSAL